MTSICKSTQAMVKLIRTQCSVSGGDRSKNWLIGHNHCTQIGHNFCHLLCCNLFSVLQITIFFPFLGCSSLLIWNPGCGKAWQTWTIVFLLLSPSVFAAQPLHLFLVSQEQLWVASHRGTLNEPCRMMQLFWLGGQGTISILSQVNNWEVDPPLGQYFHMPDSFSFCLCWILLSMFRPLAPFINFPTEDTHICLVPFQPLVPFTNFPTEDTHICLVPGYDSVSFVLRLRCLFLLYWPMFWMQVEEDEWSWLMRIQLCGN